MSGQNGELYQSVQYFDLYIYTGNQNIMQIMFSVSTLPKLLADLWPTQLGRDKKITVVLNVVIDVSIFETIFI